MHNDLVRSKGKRCNVYMNAKFRQGRIGFRHGKIRMNLEEYRLSSLPDDLIHKILSFISIKHAIRTSVLSSRWRVIWTSMPYLNFSNDDFSPNFVSNVLSRRNNQIQVSSVKLGRLSHESVKRILEYAFSHNVQQTTFTCKLENKAGSPLSPISSQSLKHLALSGSLYAYSHSMAKPAWNLPALTTLHLDHITLSDKCTALFSKYSNLKNLSLSRCLVRGTNVLNICHPRLSNLTLTHTDWWVKAFKVVAPQLKSLTVTNCYGKHLVSAPGLTTLVMTSDDPLQLSTQDFPSLENVDLCIFNPLLEDVYKIVSLLQQLHSVKFLTLNVEVLELLSLSMGPISHPPFAFANLRILKFSTIYPIRVYLEVQASTEINNYQLDVFPSAISTVVSCEEIRVLRDIASAQKVIAELRVLGLERCKSLEQSKNERLLMTKLQHIDGLLTQLPASKRDVMQATFSSVCEEANIVTNNLLDSMKIRYNRKRKRLNV